MAKKVLVVSSNSFNPNRNNGKTLEAIFSYFKKENLAQVFFSQNEDADWGFCHNYYKMTDTDILYSLRRKFIRGIQYPNMPNELSMYRVNKALSIMKRIFTKRLIIRELLWQKACYSHSDLLEWSRFFSPSVIFLLAGDLSFIYDIALFLSHKLKVPLVSYFVDDYVIYPKYRSVLGALHKKYLSKKVRLTIENSIMCFGIGEAMCQEYSKIYNKSFMPIMNLVDCSNLCIKNIFDNKVFSYFGGGSRGRIESILSFGKLLHSLHFSDIVFRVYMPDPLSNKQKKAFRKYGIQFMEAVYGQDLEEAKKTSDYLLHVESLHKRFYSKAVLSVSTKIPEYLSSGNITIGYGVPSLASMRLLSENNIGFVIDISKDIKKQSEELKCILKTDKIAISKASINYCKNHFDKLLISRKFYNQIESI